MNGYDLLAVFISDLIFNKVNEKEYGIVIKDFTEFSYEYFVDNLFSRRDQLNDHDFCIFFAGLEKHEVEKYKEKFNIYNNLFYSVEDAEEYRNNGDPKLTRIVIVKRYVPKLSSLRWYSSIKVDEVYRHICKAGINKVSKNEPVKNLWKALNSKELAKTVSLLKLVNYYKALEDTNEKNYTEKAISELYKLGLMIDVRLEQANKPSKIRKLLLENYKMVVRISTLDESDRKIIQSKAKKSNIYLSSNILKFYRSRDIAILKNLFLSEVEEFFKSVSRRKRSSTENKPNIKKPKIKSSEALGASLIIDKDEEQIKEVLDTIEEQFNKHVEEQDKNKKGRIKISTDDKPINIEIIPEIVNLIDTFVSSDSYGGIIYVNESNPIDCLKNLERYDYESFNEDIIKEIEEFLGNFQGDIGEDVKLLSIFSSFVEVRYKIVDSKFRLADAPMLKVAESADKLKLYSRYIDIYSSLISVLNDNYSKMIEYSSRGAKHVILLINALDMVYFKGDDFLHAIPTSLNPIYLWKYIELANEIKISNLDNDDKEFVIRKSNEIPNPLTATYVSGFITKTEYVIIPEVSKLGNLPIYSTEQQVINLAHGLEVIQMLTSKYINLFPHSLFRLRIAMVNPPDMGKALYVFKEVLKNSSHEVLGLDLHIYRTKETDKDWSSFDNVDESILGRFQSISNPNYNIKLHDKKISYEEFTEEANDEYHMIILFDPNQKLAGNVSSNELVKIHPLCIPNVFEYDQYYDNVLITPASEGYFFSDYNKLIQKLNDKPRDYHNSVLIESPISKKQFNNLLSKTEWLIIADQNLKNIEFDSLDTRKRLYYKSINYRDIGVYTDKWDKYNREFNSFLRRSGNYDPKEECVQNIIIDIQLLNEKGILNSISNASIRSFNENQIKGNLGLAVAYEWYRYKSGVSILASLDTDVAHRWLDEREENYLSDLIGIRFDNHKAYIDIIEVKTHSNDFSIDYDKNDIHGRAVEQVNAIYKIIEEVFMHKSRITSTSRREVLRLQIFQAFYQLLLPKRLKKDWTEKLNKLFAGEIDIEINQFIYFIDFGEHGEVEEITFDKEKPLKLVKINNKFAKKVVQNCNELMKKLSNDIEALNFEYMKNTGQSIFKKEQNMGNTKYKNDYEDMKNKNDSVFLDNIMNINNNSIDEVKEKDYIDNDINKDKNTASNKTNYSKINDLKPTTDDNLGMFFSISKESIDAKTKRLFRILDDYNINIREIDPEKVHVAPRYIRFRVRLKSGETLQKIVKYKADITREMEATFEVAIGNERGTNLVYIDIPREKSDVIGLNHNLFLLPNDTLVGNLNIIVGQEGSGDFKIIDIAKAPHMLVAGSTGSGKTIFLYTVLVCLMHKHSQENIEIILIDPKRTDFVFFNQLQYLRDKKVIIEPKEAVEMISTLADEELKRRQNLLTSCRARDLFSYNKKNPHNQLKPLVVVIDEYADLIQAADMLSLRKEFEAKVTRLAYIARNVGIHLVIATQRPSADIVTSNLKANIPCRISFRLPAHQDSMTILDAPGAEDLLGKGDMLLSLNGNISRIQGLYISEEELEEYLEEKI